MRADGTTSASPSCCRRTFRRDPESMNESSPASSPARFFGASLAEADPDLAAAVGRELERQQDGIELIASENIVSRAVLDAQGSVLTNKYAEGYPGRRYYGGCLILEIAEKLAIEPASRLFDCRDRNSKLLKSRYANSSN